MEDIVSLKNQQVKRWRKLRSRKGRETYRTYIVEGFHLVEEALNTTTVEICCIMGSEKALALLGKVDHLCPIYHLTAEIVAELSETQTSQEIFAEVRMPQLEENLKLKGPYLLLDAVQDPGNVGTLIRTAAACGFEGVVLGKGTADAYNSKTLRSAQGSHFHIHLVSGDLKQLIQKMQHENISIYGTALHQKAIEYKDVSPQEVFGLVVGNEGAGVSNDILQAVDASLYIPIRGGAESLNVSIAAAILMYHLYDPQ
ncbi:TrmH family RNA methyltransferase [Allofustis seminis]|uniref:TrmH family RNA methyltransferase n=1 Tax=Allofustis seminis TaxID=166939 RepID=UPI0003808B0F|nr:RNA methyltransferase [Allofustis seminis]